MNDIKKLMLVSPMLMAAVTAQAIDFKGVIIDKATGEPLIGATVQIEGTTTGAVTDIDGRFELGNVKDRDILIIQYVAYQSQRITVDKNLKGEITIAMSTDNQQLDEVTVVAKKNLEGERKGDEHKRYFERGRRREKDIRNINSVGRTDNSARSGRQIQHHHTERTSDSIA